MLNYSVAELRLNTKTVPFEALRMKLKAEDYSLRFVHNKEDQKKGIKTKREG